MALLATLQDQQGRAIDLAGATVQLVVDRGDSSPYTQPGIVLGPGECRFTLHSTGALAQSGRFRARVIAAVDGGMVLPSPWFPFEVD